MASFSIWKSYFRSRLQYSVSLALQRQATGQLSGGIESWTAFWKNTVQGKITYYHRSEGKEMDPTISEGDTLLVRKIPLPSLAPRHWVVSVGDVIVLKNPLDSHNHIVRRLAALGGHEMLSTDKDDEPFVLEDDECWVMSDNADLKGKEAKDSRLFGPISASNILGRVIYRLQSAENHGPILNGEQSTEWDAAVVAVELDIDEMVKVANR